MSLGLLKYKNELLDAWKDVVDDKNPNDWALFGYEKQTNDLKVIATGDGGLDELANEFNSGKVMYAFCRVTDPNTSLPKYVFINWQGEGAPLSRKGACANHVADVSNFFKGAHVTINARTEDDVDSSVVVEKVAKASASKFNFKERADSISQYENIAPVGSVYKRIQPTREINPIEREKFWEKEQAEEKQRVVIERKKAEEEKKKLELERKEREVKENAARDIVVKERAHSISQLKEAEKNADNISRTQEYEKKQWEKQLQDDAQEERRRRIRSESLRRERSDEAQTLISKRTINARAIFEQNTCAGQLYSVNTNRQPKVLQEFEAAARKEEEEEVNGVNLENTEPQESTNLGATGNDDVFTQKERITSEFSYTRNLVKQSKVRLDSETGQSIEEEEHNWDEPTSKTWPDEQDLLNDLLPEDNTNPSVQETNQVIAPAQANNGLRARALYDYQAADETEISFDPEDIITQIEQIDEGWWQGMAPDGSYGLFPANYVELLPSSPWSFSSV